LAVEALQIGVKLDRQARVFAGIHDSGVEPCGLRKSWIPALPRGHDGGGGGDVFETVRSQNPRVDQEI
jgi:hypothetical protein